MSVSFAGASGLTIQTPVAQCQGASTQPFTSSDPPVLLEAKARRLPQWMMVDDSAAPPPVSPVKPAAKKGEQDVTVTLIPYGAARLRITSFPMLAPNEPPNQ